MRAHQNTWGRVSQAQNWGYGKDNGLVFVVMVIVVNFGCDAGECTDKLDISSVHVQWFSH